MERFRSAALAGIAVVGCLAMAGCGTQDRHAAAARPLGTAGASTSPKPTPTPSPSAHRGPLPVSGKCTTAQLTITSSSRRTVTGLHVERFLATDTSKLACSLDGSPVLTPYGPLSSASSVTSDIAVSQQDFEGDDEGDPSPSRIDLQPGQAAAFDVAWWPASPVVCLQASGFGFRAPDDQAWSTAQRVAYPFGKMCDGLFYVSTLRPPTR
jgi:hypothetical protein